MTDILRYDSRSVFVSKVTMVDDLNSQAQVASKDKALFQPCHNVRDVILPAGRSLKQSASSIVTSTGPTASSVANAIAGGGQAVATGQGTGTQTQGQQTATAGVSGKFRTSIGHNNWKV